MTPQQLLQDMNLNYQNKIGDPWYSDAWLVAIDGRYELYIFRTEHTYDITWYDTLIPNSPHAYSTLHEGTLSGCLMILDILARHNVVCDKTKSTLLLRHGSWRQNEWSYIKRQITV